MVCLKALALSIAAISALITTVTLASPVERQLRRFDVSADCATYQAGAERVPCSGTQEHGRAAAHDVQLTGLYVRYPFPCYTLQRLKNSRAHLLGPKQGPHSQQLDPMLDMDPGVHHLIARDLEMATTEESLARPRTIEALSHIDSFDAERRDERRTAQRIHSPRHSKRVDLVSFRWLMRSFRAMPTSLKVHVLLRQDPNEQVGSPGSIHPSGLRPKHATILFLLPRSSLFMPEVRLGSSLHGGL